MTRRRNPPSHRAPPGSPRSSGRKQEENKDSELRQARAVKKAQEQEKLRLRRGDWNTEPDADEKEPDDLDSGESPWNADFGADDGDTLPEDEASEG